MQLQTAWVQVSGGACKNVDGDPGLGWFPKVPRLPPPLH